MRITDIQNNHVDWDNVPFCNIEEKDINKYLLYEGDIVFARTGATTGKSYLIKGKIPRSVYASYLIRVQPKISEVFQPFLYQFFQSSDYWNQISLNSTGSAQGGVNATKLSELNIPLSTLAEQKRIVVQLDKLSTETKQLESIYQQKINDLDELKKSILKKAFNGEL